MNHSLRFACLLLLMGGLFHSNALAQIQFGGLLDLELRKGGADSSPYINQTPGDKLSLYTPNIRLFIGSNNLTKKIKSKLSNRYLEPCCFCSAQPSNE